MWALCSRFCKGSTRAFPGFQAGSTVFFLMGLPQGFGLLLFALYLLGAQGSVHLSAQCFGQPGRYLGKLG